MVYRARDERLGRDVALKFLTEPITFVEEFFRHLLTSGQRCLIGRGRCSERLAGSEAYLPFLEALDDLIRAGLAESAGHAMKQLAPSWSWRRIARRSC